MGKAGKNVVRDFIYGCWCNGRRIGGMSMPPLTDLLAATHVRREGLDVEFLDAQYQPEDYDRHLGNKFSDILAVAVMSSTQSFKNDVETLEYT